MASVEEPRWGRGDGRCFVSASSKFFDTLIWFYQFRILSLGS